MPPDPSTAHHELLKDALEQHRSGRLDEAAQRYRQILSREPEYADCLHLLGMVAFQQGDAGQAVDLIRRAIAIHWHRRILLLQSWQCASKPGEDGEAEACYRRALALRPDQAEVHLNLGNILKAQGAVDAALVSYQQRPVARSEPWPRQKSRNRRPVFSKASSARAGRVLKLAGVPEIYDTRPRNYSQPCWEGERIARGRVLIWGEQGVGDEIMFAGLLRDVIARGNHCVLECDARLKPLFARSFPEIEVVSGYDPDFQPEMRIVHSCRAAAFRDCFGETSKTSPRRHRLTFSLMRQWSSVSARGMMMAGRW